MTLGSADLGMMPGTPAGGRRESARQRAARRHSRLVRILRFLFPALGVLIFVGMIGLIVLFNLFSSVGATNLILTADGLVMDFPVLSGHDGEKSYKVTARRAIQRLSDPRILDLEFIDADIVLSPSEKARVTSVKGIYNNSVESLKLYDGVQLNWSQGYKVDVSEVDIDMKSGALKTSEPVAIRSDKGQLRGGKLDYDQDKGVVRFTDGVRMTIAPPEKSAEGQQ